MASSRWDFPWKLPQKRDIPVPPHVFVAMNGREGKKSCRKKGGKGKKKGKNFIRVLSSSRSAACPWIPPEFSRISTLEEQSALLERQLRSEIPFSHPKSSRIRAEKAEPGEI